MVFVIDLDYAVITTRDTVNASNLLLNLGANLTRGRRQRVSIRLYFSPFLAKEWKKFITIDTTV